MPLTCDDADDQAQMCLPTAELRSGADAPELPAALTDLVEALQAAGIHELPKTLLADAGYFSEANIEAATEAGIDPLIATGRQKHGTKPPAAPRGRIPKGLTPKQLMARKLSTNKGKAAYARRKAIVEPARLGQRQRRSLRPPEVGDCLALWSGLFLCPEPSIKRYDLLR